MSYNYYVSPAIVIAGNDLKNVKYALDVTRDDEVMVALESQGFSAAATFEPGDGGLYSAGVEVSHFGKIPEREGIQGVVRAFRKFIDFTGSNIPQGEYTLTDENGEVEVVTVGWGLSIVSA